MRGTGRRRVNSAVPDQRHLPPTPSSSMANDAWKFLSTGGGRVRDHTHPPQPPTPSSATDPRQFYSSAGGRRDSDASFASSRPSSAGTTSRPSGVPNSDRQYQASCLRTINAYLSSHSLPFTLKAPLPSAKDITETLKFILLRFGFSPNKLEDDLQTLLKALNCPVKLNKSALRAPGTPHSWPSMLAAIHWLVQLCRYDEHKQSLAAQRPVSKHLKYAFDSYCLFIKGQDEQLNQLDEEIEQVFEEEKEKLVQKMGSLDETVKSQEGVLEAMMNGPSPKEVLEKEKSMLEEDLNKFNALVEQLEGHKVQMDKLLGERENLLKAKVTEKERILAENEELKKGVDEQSINARDAERMKKELQALEREIQDIQSKRDQWEEKTWDLHSSIGDEFKKLEEIMIEGNLSIKRLKLGSGLQYQLNGEGSSPAEVLGIDYKTTLKPMLASFEDETNKSYMGKLEERISLQQQLVQKTSKVESKKKCVAALQAHIDKVEALLDLAKKEKEEFISRCRAEARRMVEEVEIENQNISLVEKEAADCLKASKAKLEETVAQTEEEEQKCARELFLLVDRVSKYKEYVGSKIVTMKNDLAEAVKEVADMHKAALPKVI